jgi:hypothetical protein
VRGNIEYLTVTKPNVEQSGVVLLEEPSDEMRSTYHIARDVFEGQQITTIALRPRKDFVATSDGEHRCEVLLHRFRDDEGLLPKQEIIEHNLGCDARYVRLSESIGDAIVAWSWGGNALVLELSVLLWDRSAFVPIEIEGSVAFENGGQFAFADLNGDGIKELVVTLAGDEEEGVQPTLVIFKLSSDRPLVYRAVDRRKAEFKHYFDAVIAVSDPSVWEWVEPGDVGIKTDDSESNDKP